MIEELFKLKKITHAEYEDYILFACSEMGRNWFKRNMMLAFMDEPSPDHCVGEAFAYTSGKCSMFRNIQAVIDKVNKLLKDIEDDNQRTKE